jgi:prepilin-type N-terminal cleavage/methylation domain-containing protein
MGGEGYHIISMANNTMRRSSGFTIVELIVVISIVAVLAAITTLGYGAWQSSLKQNQVKSDLAAAAGAMEDARTFGDDYPLALPSSFTPSEGSEITLSVPGLNAYCIDGTIESDNSIEFYIDNLTRIEGAQEGTCAGRGVAVSLAAPASASIIGVSGTNLSLSWDVVAGATEYEIQCSPDQSYVVVLASATASGGGTNSYSFEDVDPAAMYYCRVRAVNAGAESAWTQTGSGTNDGTYGSLPVATSIEGYWATAPTGFLLEDGSAVSRTTYADLFAVIGTTHGAGDGSTTFNLPDSRGRTTVNKNASDAEFAAIGQKTGSKTEQLTTAQMPSHTHVQNAHDHNAGNAAPYVAANSPGTPVFSNAGSAFGFRYNTSVPSPSTTATNQDTGSSQAHDNIQPSIVKVSAIKYTSPSAGSRTLPAGTSLSGYWTTAPTGYLIEDGSAVSRTTYSTLFGTVGTTHGSGDGSTTFNLPNSQGRVAVNISSTDSEYNVLGEKTGAKREQITTAQMPSHTHVQDTHNHNGGFANPYVTSGAFGGTSVSSQAGSSFGYHLRAGSSATATNQNTGGGQDHNNIQPSIVKLVVIKYTDESGSGSQAVAVGTSVPGYWSVAPEGYLYEDGSAVSRSTYGALFDEIGTTFGAGDGSTTFNLPDSRGRIGVNKSNTDTEFDTIGEKYGSKTQTLTIAQMPSHTHVQDAHNHNGGGIVYMSDGNFGGTQTVTQNGLSYGFHISTHPSVVAVNQNSGSGSSHNNIMPSIAVRFVIKY